MASRFFLESGRGCGIKFPHPLLFGCFILRIFVVC
nr:MAG TPA: hypothetical protein [Caudoviricetes sp.]